MMSVSWKCSVFKNHLYNFIGLGQMNGITSIWLERSERRSWSSFIPSEPSLIQLFHVVVERRCQQQVLKACFEEDLESDCIQVCSLCMPMVVVRERQAESELIARDPMIAGVCEALSYDHQVPVKSTGSPQASAEAPQIPKWFLKLDRSC